jgi:NADH-quinone oxidoreductase subunit M
VVLGALYMLWFAQRFLFGATKAPEPDLRDLTLRERAILAAIVVAVFAIGLFPQEPMSKTELAALEYQMLVGPAPTSLAASAVRVQRPPRALAATATSNQSQP